MSFPVSKKQRNSMPPPASSGKGSSKGKTKQKQFIDTPKWSSVDNTGTEICRNYHFGICQLPADKCRRSHLCPNLKQDGSGCSACSGNHMAFACPCPPPRDSAGLKKRVLLQATSPPGPLSHKADHLAFCHPHHTCSIYLLALKVLTDYSPQSAAEIRAFPWWRLTLCAAHIMTSCLTCSSRIPSAHMPRMEEFGLFSEGQDSHPPGPAPLRARQHDYDWNGLPNLPTADAQKILTDNALLQFIMDISSLVHANGGFYAIEHPADPGHPFGLAPG
eukprot:5554495-Amphidinium_carterae.2